MSWFHMQISYVIKPVPETCTPTQDVTESPPCFPDPMWLRSFLAPLPPYSTSPWPPPFLGRCWPYLFFFSNFNIFFLSLEPTWCLSPSVQAFTLLSGSYSHSELLGFRPPRTMAVHFVILALSSHPPVVLLSSVTFLLLSSCLSFPSSSIGFFFPHHFFSDVQWF